MGRLLLVQAVALVSVFLLAGCGGGGGGGGRALVQPWANSYGGANYDTASSIQQTSDGGYIVAGGTQSFGLIGDLWVLKLNSGGAISWQKTYGGVANDEAYSIQQTSDGEYIVAGNTYSFGAADKDFWILKLNSGGAISWQKMYGGTEYDYVHSIQQTSDGGYIVAGDTSSFGASFSDFWVLKLNADGTLIDDGTGTSAWQKRYGGAGYEYPYSVQQTSDGGYIVAGSLDDGDSDSWVLKLNSDGTVAWQKTYGSTEGDEAYSIQQTIDGGYIMTGYTDSFGTDDYDFWVLKLNSVGAVTWEKTYGGTGCEEAYSICQTNDGGYVLTGYTDSFGAVSEDFWVLKLDSDGSVEWQKRYGGADDEEAFSIQQTSDGGYTVTGYSSSFGTGDYDFWVLKLRSNGTIAFNPASGATVTDTDATVADTSASVDDTSVSAELTSATVTVTDAIPAVTDATVVQQAP
jgi:uncharacterized delta-60 repeat protein